jgi:hypothetical protein
MEGTKQCQLYPAFLGVSQKLSTRVQSDPDVLASSCKVWSAAHQLVRLRVKRSIWACHDWEWCKCQAWGYRALVIGHFLITFYFKIITICFPRQAPHKANYEGETPLLGAVQKGRYSDGWWHLHAFIAAIGSYWCGSRDMVTWEDERSVLGLGSLKRHIMHELCINLYKVLRNIGSY